MAIMGNLFLSGEHKANWAKCIAKDETGSGDIERRVLFYILCGSQDIWEKGINNIYDFNNHGIKKVNFKKLCLCSSSKSLINLAFNLYNGYAPRGGLNPMDLFCYLDKHNTELVLNALKIRFERH